MTIYKIHGAAIQDSKIQSVLAKIKNDKLRNAIKPGHLTKHQNKSYSSSNEFGIKNQNKPPKKHVR